jgi:calcineurin-like phosphoesterase family protein
MAPLIRRIYGKREKRNGGRAVIFFTADQHFDHYNIIKYCTRPYSNTDEMNHDLITKFNEVVTPQDRTIHVGDFTLKGTSFAQSIIKQLNGTHTFLLGSHDYWMKKKGLQIWEKKVEGSYIVACHYALHTWPRSHFNSWHVFGHSHGNLQLSGKRHDVGVDNNAFYPVSYSSLAEIMDGKSDNFNLVKK